MLRRILLHNTAFMSPPLILALALSLALHGGLLFSDAIERLLAAPPRPALQASLRLPPKPEAVPAEPLLKNTLDNEAAAQIAKPSSRAPVGRKVSAKSEIRAAQKKISQHIYYPPEAVARGIEGEVRLLLKLAADGSIADVQIAAGSGHPVLDNAAIKAAYAMGGLEGGAARELLLPVIFRLQ